MNIGNTSIISHCSEKTQVFSACAGYISRKIAKTTSDHFKEVFISMKQEYSRKHPFRLFMLLALMAVLMLPARAATVECTGSEAYCFRAEDFMGDRSPGSGIYLCEVPDESVGTLRYGARALKTGDVLPAEALDCLVFSPTEARDTQACLSYYTIWDDHLSDESVLTIRLHSGENQAPTAKDVTMETYKNLEKSAAFDAADPDGDALTYQIVTTPKRGELTVEEGGTFLYKPKENKVGKDSFTYTVTDAEGAVSNEATVNIEILKPMDKAAYADMEGDPNEFEALWLRNTGLMGGAEVSGHACFYPEQTVSRGEYLVMVMELCDMPPEEGTQSTFADSAETPKWMQPYLCSALRRGIIQGEMRDDALCFCPNEPVTQAQAAVMVQNILKLDIDPAADVFAPEGNVPVWAESSLRCLSQAGMEFPSADAPLTRRDAACMLYRLSQLI